MAQFDVDTISFACAVWLLAATARAQLLAVLFALFFVFPQDRPVKGVLTPLSVMWTYLRLLCCATTLLAAPLEPAEHAVLMSAYDKFVPPLDASLFPRFSVGQSCAGIRITCTDGKVTGL